MHITPMDGFYGLRGSESTFGVTTVKRLSSRSSQQREDYHISSPTMMKPYKRSVRYYGYSGVFIGQNRYSNRATQFLPSHCIICLHNESMNYEERHITFSTNSDIAVHIGSHFRYLKLGDTMYCPATVLGGATEPLCDYEHAMDPQEAWEHIQDVHYGFKFPTNYAPSATATGCIRGKRTFPEGNSTGDSTKKTMVYKNKKPCS
jgi:hypothetical protein